MGNPSSRMRNRSAERSPASSPESQARRRIKTLWQLDDLCHMTDRYPHKRGLPRIDRLAGILRRGLVAPARCEQGLVRSDLNIVVTGCKVAYDTLVFLHWFGPQSFIYTLCEPGRFAVFLDPTLPVITQEEMGEEWPVLCLDEEYVCDRVPVDRIIGVAVHPDDGAAVLQEFADEFRRLAIPLYDYDSNVLWPGSVTGV